MRDPSRYARLASASTDALAAVLVGAWHLAARVAGYLGRRSRPSSAQQAELKAGMGEKAVLIMVTLGARDDAERLGEALVTQRLAGCCSVVPTVHSIYFWEGRLQREHEALLLIKTVESRAAAAEEYVRTHHEYQLPEILRLPIEGGSAAYLDWLESQVVSPPHIDKG